MPVLDEMGYELVDLKFVFEGSRWYLRFFIDKEGGVGISDCERVSREVGTLLEVEDVIPSAFVLEVSSPGLDRPLFRPADFVRFDGRLAKVRTKKPLEGQKVFTGRLSAADDKGFTITTEGGKALRIEHADVDKARLEVEF
ncbi:MAG: ribosome maturation factor RimP [Nitrospirae bacterium]|nr:ribosome maturation factor RimP [Nitrospirota bacterium]